MHALLMLGDAFVSLHRSEGFGLPLCEAMAMGKPVIGTGYSANVDFMNAQNSMLVRHRLVEIDEDHGPYRAGWIWAEPDVDHAAELMRRLVDEPGLAAYLGNRARRDIAREMSPARIGEMIASRLHALIEQRMTYHGYENSVLRKAELYWLQDFQDLNNVSCKSHRRLLGPILTVLRKATAYLLRPVFNCQNKYNEKMSEAVATLVQRLCQQQHELVELTRVLHQQRFRARDDESADTEAAPHVAA